MSEKDHEALKLAVAAIVLADLALRDLSEKSHEVIRVQEALHDLERRLSNQLAPWL